MTAWFDAWRDLWRLRYAAVPLAAIMLVVLAVLTDLALDDRGDRLLTTAVVLITTVVLLGLAVGFLAVLHRQCFDTGSLPLHRYVVEVGRTWAWFAGPLCLGAALGAFPGVVAAAAIAGGFLSVWATNRRLESLLAMTALAPGLRDLGHRTYTAGWMVRQLEARRDAPPVVLGEAALFAAIRLASAGEHTHAREALAVLDDIAIDPEQDAARRAIDAIVLACEGQLDAAKLELLVSASASERVRDIEVTAHVLIAALEGRASDALRTLDVWALAPHRRLRHAARVHAYASVDPDQARRTLTGIEHRFGRSALELAQRMRGPASSLASELLASSRYGATSSSSSSISDPSAPWTSSVAEPAPAISSRPW